jgi:hypothetical protein
MKYIAPIVLEGSFTCPHCNAISQQIWWGIGLDGTNYNEHRSLIHRNNVPIRVGKCTHCNKNTIWLNEKMLHPASSNAPVANSEMPQNVRDIYDEALGHRVQQQLYCDWRCKCYVSI